MVINDIGRHIAIGRETIVYSKNNVNIDYDLKIKYKINKEDKEIRLYDVPKILTFQEKAMIFYGILDNYYFYPLRALNKSIAGERIEEYVVKENGYTYHEFNGIEGNSNGILGELVFEIPRQQMEPEKLSRIRDIYEMLTRNINEIGKRPICIAFNGIMPDFKDIFRIIEYFFNYDNKIKEKKKDCLIFKRSGLFGGNKRIFIVPKKMQQIKEETVEKNEIKEKENSGE